MKKELPTKYDHLAVEKGKYQQWLDKEYFKAGDLTKKPYSIVIPPPNVTGKLHLGHAWDTTMQDMIIRYKRMQGYDALWLPGMDHAGLATQAKVEARLREQGISRYDLGREKLVDKIWEWKEEYADNIHSQWAKLGLGLDYTKERFTLDEGLSNAVKHVFVTLYNEGLIYRGERIINWDPVAMTALSNEEVIYKDVPGAFYHIKYFIEGTQEFLEVATTRPETLFGDTAVAVNPNDERYNKLIGKNVVLPIVNKLIPIIGDEHADMEFGTGVVKITPAHDPNDFEVGNRHNLERIVVMNPNGTMNENAGKYNGMDRFECRDAVIKDLDSEGLLIKIEPINHNVGFSERSDVMVEPYLSKQWFVKMRPLADRVLENQKDKDKKVNFVPPRYEKTMNHWMEITYDWCISRQLWWGHRIPAWYKGDEVYVGMEEPKGDGWVQDNDVLDTWFSSALWPFSTLGWPDNTDLLKRYYPNNVLVTGYDIIPFWVARMIFSGLEHTGVKPFSHVLIHGLVRDELGRKMSKSLGNGVDPLEVIDKYGADALRLTLVTGNSPGNDMRWTDTKVTASRNFANKLWNASRYILMNLPEDMEKAVLPETLPIEDKWVLTLYNKLIREVTDNIEAFELGIAIGKLYDFIWDVYCDWYIELTKPRIAAGGETARAAQNVLVYVMQGVLKLLHPFMPFITEEIWQSMPVAGQPESIMIAKWCEYDEKLNFAAEAEAFTKIIDAIKAIRVQRNELNVPPSKKVSMHIETADTALFDSCRVFFERLAGAGELEIAEKVNAADGMVTVVTSAARVFMPMGELVDTEKELVRLEKEKKNAQKDIDFLSGKLNNSGFLAKAPAQQVENERAKLAKAQEKMNKIIESINALKK